MFRIIASDLDGTLLTPDQQLTSFTKKILQLLTTTYNIHFVFATGRHYKSVTQIRDNLDISAYMITSNGARIHNIYGQLIAAYNLDVKIVSNLLRIVHHDVNIITNVFRDDEWLINRLQLNSEINYRGYDCKYKIYQADTLPLDGICKIYFTSNQYKRLLELEEELNAIGGDYINVSFSLPTCLEVMPGGVSKGHALRKVANLLGYQLKDCIAFGDGMNDQEMLSMTGKGCIMRNALQRLKDTLPGLEVIGSNAEEAVPRYLQYIYFDKDFNILSIN